MGYFRDGAVIPVQSSAPPTPVSGFGLVYPKTDGKWYVLGSDGVERELGYAPTPINPSRRFVWTHCAEDISSTAFGMFRLNSTSTVGTTASATSTEFGVWRLLTTTSANQLGRIYTLSTTRVPDGTVFCCKVNVTLTTDIRIVFGLMNQATTSYGNNEISFRLEGTTLIGVCDNAGSETPTATSYTITQGVEYILYWKKSSTSLVTFKVYSVAGALLWSDTVTTNIIGSDTAASVQIIGWKTSATAVTTEYNRVDFIGYGHEEGFILEYGAAL